MLGKMIKLATAIAGIAIAGSANALSMTFVNPGDMLSTEYIFSIDSANIDVTVVYDLTSITSTTAIFGVTLHNASTGTGQNRLVSFGVDVVSPTLTGASTTNSLPTPGEWDAALGVNFPGFQKVALCSYAGNNCAGGSNQGIFQGGPNESFTLTLTGPFGTTTPSIMFTSPFPGKFQGVGSKGNSYEVDACASPGNCNSIPVPVPDNGVPEPGTLALLGFGLLGLQAVRRRIASR